MRTIHRFAAAVAGLAAIATPVALAAPIDITPADATIDPPASESAVLSDVRAADERADRLRREHRRGPFHPIRSTGLDYGESGAVYGASRGGRAHEGQDVFAPSGTPLVAVADGEVVESGSDGGRGNYISIHDPDAKRTYNYFHLVAPAAAKAGEKVDAGERIGAVGCSGSCWGDHLHFEVRRGSDPYGASIDPLPILRDLPQARK